MDIAALRAAGARHLIQGELLSDVVPAADGPVFVRADGAEIFDSEGQAYLDFNSGQMCSALGHNNPRVTQAVRDGLGRLTHASSVYFNEPQLRLAARLAETFDAPLSRSLFIQSGADSNEAAVLFARRATGRSGIGALHLSFHGYTDVTRAMSFAAAAGGHGPPIPDLHAIPAPYAYRSPVGADGDDWWAPLLSIAFDLLDRECPNNLAAVIAEPLISAGGVIEMPPGYLKALKAGLAARGALLILDEAQTGLGKLGTLYAYQQHGVVPDIMTLSKHFGGGLPISAMVTTDDIAERALEGGLTFGHSHSSDPIACTAGLASLEEILAEDLPARARAIGARWRERMESLQQRFPMIGDLRGKGCLQGGRAGARPRHQGTRKRGGEGDLPRLPRRPDSSSRCGASTATCSASCRRFAPAMSRSIAPSYSGASAGAPELRLQWHSFGTRPRRPGSRRMSRPAAGVIALVLGAALVLTISNGLRSSFGLFGTPISLDLGISRETFALAIAIQGIVWGITQPFFGALADRHGAIRIVLLGTVIYVAGLLWMASTDGALGLHLGQGLLVGHRHQRHRVRGGAGPGGACGAAGKAQHGARYRCGRRLLRTVRACPGGRCVCWTASAGR